MGDNSGVLSILPVAKPSKNAVFDTVTTNILYVGEINGLHPGDTIIINNPVEFTTPPSSNSLKYWDELGVVGTESVWRTKLTVPPAFPATPINAVLDPAFDGSLRLSDSVATGNVVGAARGQLAVDLQRVRSVATAVAAGRASLVHGFNNRAGGGNSHAEGESTSSSGLDSHAEGLLTTANEQGSHSEGESTIASGGDAHAEGLFTTASAFASHSEGDSTKATGRASHAEGAVTLASGLNSHAEGISTTASGVGSHAEGSATTASAPNSHAEGISTTASADNSHAEGERSIASSTNAHAEGQQTTASGTNAHSEGFTTISSGYGSHSEGDSTTASGDGSHAEGHFAQATFQGSHAEGFTTTAGAVYAHAEGDSTTATGRASHAEGNLTTASGLNSHAEGFSTIASGSYSHAEGNATKSIGSASHAEGQVTTASGTTSHAEGFTTTASAFGSHAEGDKTLASGGGSHAEGLNTESSAQGAHAEGTSTLASGVFSHAEGDQTSATFRASHAEGLLTTAGANYAHAEGNGTSATGVGSHAEGNLSQATGDYSHATGLSTIASGDRSTTAGESTQASGTNSHSEGYQSIAGGYASHAEGEGNAAYGRASHAEGYFTVANGVNAHSEGTQTEARGDSSHAEGSSCLAIGLYSHAEGTRTSAVGSSAHAEGTRTIATGDFAHSGGNYVESSGSSSFSHYYAIPSQQYVTSGIGATSFGVIPTNQVPQSGPMYNSGFGALTVGGSVQNGNALVHGADYSLIMGQGCQALQHTGSFQIGSGNPAAASSAFGYGIGTLIWPNTGSTSAVPAMSAYITGQWNSLSPPSFATMMPWSKSERSRRLDAYTAKTAAHSALDVDEMEKITKTASYASYGLFVTYSEDEVKKANKNSVVVVENTSRDRVLGVTANPNSTYISNLTNVGTKVTEARFGTNVVDEFGMEKTWSDWSAPLTGLCSRHNIDIASYPSLLSLHEDLCALKHQLSSQPLGESRIGSLTESNAKSLELKQNMEASYNNSQFVRTTIDHDFAAVYELAKAKLAEPAIVEENSAASSVDLEQAHIEQVEPADDSKSVVIEEEQCDNVQTKFFSELAQLKALRVSLALPDKPQWSDEQVAKGRNLVRTEQEHRWVAVINRGTAKVQQDGSCCAMKLVDCGAGGKATLSKDDVESLTSRMLCLRVIDANWVEISL